MDSLGISAERSPLVLREPVWPSGKALGWLEEGPRLESALTVLSLQKGCGLWTLSCDLQFVPDS